MFLSPCVCPQRDLKFPHALGRSYSWAREAVGLRPRAQQSRIPVSGTKAVSGGNMGMWIQQLREPDADKEKKADGSSRAPDLKPCLPFYSEASKMYVPHVILERKRERRENMEGEALFQKRLYHQNNTTKI